MNTAAPPSTVTLLGVDVHRCSFDETVGWIVRRAESGEGGVVCTPNVDHIVKAARSVEFHRALQAADLRVPDGMGIIYGSRIAGRALSATVTGRLLPEAVAQRLQPTRSIAVFGGPPGVAEIAGATLAAAGATVVEAFGPSMGFAIGSDEDAAAVAKLVAARPSVVFVGLGAPKQEVWMAAHRHELPEAVLVGVGAAVDVLGGRVRGAPRWLTRVGLEWAFRLAQEPGRLAVRYLWDDPRFFWWMVRTRLGAEPRFSRA